MFEADIKPLLANIALSVIDEHFSQKWQALGPSWTRAKRRRAGEPAMRLVRNADDFVVMISGTRADAEALWDEVGQVLAPMGLRLSEEKLTRRAKQRTLADLLRRLNPVLRGWCNLRRLAGALVAAGA